MQWITDAAIAVLLGFLAGIGTGGGSLLILWLTLIRGMDPGQARSINLLFFLPGALIASLLHKHQGRVSYRKLLPAIAAGCLAAAGASLIGKNLDTDLLKKLFGGLLLIAGLRELFYRPKH